MTDIEEARRVFKIEAQCILDMMDKLDHRFEEAVDLILNCKGKLIVSGMGKSGQIGRKIASTFSSTGTPAIFLHPAEGSHGDLGVISEGDLVLGISYRGQTEEMVPLLKYLGRKGVPLIALTGSMDSPLAEASKVALDVSVTEEACPLKLAPTSSSTVTLVMGDALATATLKRRGFSEKNFAEVHPQGGLGRKLLTKVSDLMFSGEALPLVQLEMPMSEVISLMTGREVRGTAGVVDDQGQLIGIITDGDIRRRLEKAKDPLSDCAKDLMSHSPKTIDCNELAERALFVMEQFQIQTLFVVDKSSAEPTKPVGLLNFQDLLKAKIR